MRAEAAPAIRVVVTGVGTLSPVARGGGAALAGALAAGAPALRTVQAFATDGCPSRLAGEVDDLAGHLAGDEGRRLPRVSQLAVIAARLALADAGVEPGALPTLGLVLGSYWGDLRSSETFARGFLARGPLGLSPLVFPSTVMNAMAAHVAIALGVRGPMLTVNDLGAAGDLAVAQAAGLLAAGRATAILAGGVDEICPIVYRELARRGALSATEPGPEGCRPFDRTANGTVLGEGGTLLLLETQVSAAARGARVYAEVAGAAWGSLPGRLRAPARGPRPEPVTVRRALAAADVPGDAVDVAYLTGAGEPGHDAAELDLVARALGPSARTRLTALTPLTGDHAGIGALRVGAAALAVSGGPVAGLPAPPASPPARLTFVASPRPAGAAEPCRAALAHGLGRTGVHVAVVLRPGPSLLPRVA